MAAVSSSPGQRSTRYRRRKPLPALLLIVLLGFVAGMVWFNVLGTTEPQVTECPPPTSPTAVAGVPAPPAAPYEGQVRSPTALDEVAPAPPQLARFRVLNGNGERGEAGIVGGGLAELGFAPAAEPTNDPLHPAFDLACHGQIRFGTAGQSAARTLSLVVPCAELVSDARPDDVVDVALGTEFTELRPTPESRTVLQRLVQLGEPVQPRQGGGQAAGPVQPVIDPELLKAARDVEC
ncbi:MAG: envelope integrity protein Cei [Pseudonocardiaceae bacterium]